MYTNNNNNNFSTDVITIKCFRNEKWSSVFPLVRWWSKCSCMWAKMGFCWWSGWLVESWRGCGYNFYKKTILAGLAEMGKAIIQVCILCVHLVWVRKTVRCVLVVVLVSNIVSAVWLVLLVLSPGVSLCIVTKYKTPRTVMKPTQIL